MSDTGSSLAVESTLAIGAIIYLLRQAHTARRAVRSACTFQHLLSRLGTVPLGTGIHPWSLHPQDWEAKRAAWVHENTIGLQEQPETEASRSRRQSFEFTGSEVAAVC